MSDREGFVAQRKTRWQRLELLLLDSTTKRASEWSELASGYRAICSDLATAQSLEFGDDIVNYLDGLAGRAHNKLYASERTRGLSMVKLLLHDFPRELRTQWKFFLASNILFYGPFIFSLIGAMVSTEFALAMLPEAQLEAMESMYSNSDLKRNAGGDATMAGFYVRNNIGIALRCFATGALFGLGPIVVLVQNGLAMGTTMGYLTASGLGANLLTFVCGHSAWELTGIVVAGAGGFRMGWALIDTGGMSRVGSLRAAGPSLYRLVAGTIALLAVAAAIEGFWSASPVPPVGKYFFGMVQVAIVTLWLSLGGRGERT